MRALSSGLEIADDFDDVQLPALPDFSDAQCAAAKKREKELGRGCGALFMLISEARERQLLTLLKGKSLDALGHGIAYSLGVTLIESSCSVMDEDGWIDTSCVDELAQEDVKEVLIYLNRRGLLELHTIRDYWVKVRDESEAGSSGL